MATIPDADSLTRVAELGITLATLVSSLLNRKKLSKVREHQVKTKVPAVQKPVGS